MLVFALFAGNSLNGQTKLVSDIFPGPQGSYPLDFFVLDSTLLFTAKDTAEGFEMWSVDFQDSTKLRSNIFPGKSDGFSFGFNQFGSKVYFSASDSGGGHELWSFDGSTSQLESSIFPDSLSSWPEEMITFSGALYFSARDSANGTELWKYDGTVATLVSDIFKDTSSSFPSNFTEYSGNLYFTATDSAHGRELWRYNGSTVSLVSDLNAGVDGSFPLDMFVHGGELFFSANNGTTGFELFKYNGSTISLVNDIYPGTASSYPHYFTTYLGDLYFSAKDSANGIEVRKYDGLGVSLVEDLLPGSLGSNPADFVLYDSNLYFSANDGSVGYELWYLDRQDSIHLATNINPGAGNAFPINLTEFNGSLYFQASTLESGTELWSYTPCDLPDKPSLSVRDTALCIGESFNFAVLNSDSLRGASYWVLYEDTLGLNPIDSSVNGTFMIHLDSARTYFVRGEGCDLPGPYDSITVQVLIGSIDTAQAFLCSGDSLIFGSRTIKNPGWYRDTLIGSTGCDSIVNLDVQEILITNDTITSYLCVGDSILFGGNYYSSPGFYSAVYSSSFGCDSIVTLNLGVLPLIGTTLNDSICEGDSLVFGSQVLKTSGTYQTVFQASNTCDSTVTLNLTVLNTVRDTIRDTICANESYLFGINSLMNSGTFLDTLIGSNNCDSIVVLNLVVHPIYSDTTYAEICEGSSYLFQGITYSTPGTYHDSSSSRFGCDSVNTFVLKVNPVYADTFNIQICTGDTFYLNNQPYDSAGTYSAMFNTTDGCDSSVVVNLSLLPVYQDSIRDTICNGLTYAFGGLSITTSGSYRWTFVSSDGCDSIVDLDLLVLNSFRDTTVARICAGDSLLFHGNQYKASGFYTHTKTSGMFCDSAFVLNLTVNPVYNFTVQDTICTGDTIAFGNQLLTTSGMFSHTYQTTNGCDSTVLLELNVNPVYSDTIQDTVCDGTTYQIAGQSFTTSGFYHLSLTSTTGCDSSVYLNLTVLPTYDDTLYTYTCKGQPLTIGNRNLNSAGVHYINLQSQYGCDSTLTVFLAVMPTFQDTLYASICDGDSIAFDHLTLKDSGTYSITYNSEFLCDSTVTMIVDKNVVYRDTLRTSVCAGNTFLFGGNLISSPGQYVDSLRSSDGCDSVIWLDFSLRPVLRDTMNVAICQGTSFAFGGRNITTAGTYQDTLLSRFSCDSIVTLNLNLIRTYNVNRTATICSGQTYTLGNQTFSTSGNYAHTFTSSLGCDSTVNLNLQVLPNANNSISATICQGGFYTFGSSSLTNAGTYYDTLIAGNGCDSTVELQLTVRPTYATSIADTICSGSIYSLGSQTLYLPGQYTEVFQSAYGCDSIVTLNLHVLQSYDQQVFKTICANQTYQLGSQIISASGTYVEVFQAANGCDSTINLHLTVLPTYNTSTLSTICTGDTLLFGSQTITSMGSYTEVFQATNGCDSTVNLTVVENPTYSRSIARAICDGDSIVLGSQTLITSGTYTETFTSAVGCDSTVTINLTVYPVYADTVATNICQGQSYVFGSQTLKNSGIYDEVFQSINGCDSLVNLTLTVNPTFSIRDTVEICEGSTYFFGTQKLDSSGTYNELFSTVNGCDSAVTLDLIVHPQFFDTLQSNICTGDTFILGSLNITTTGWHSITYQSVNGCDSTISAHVTVLPTYNESTSLTICQGTIYPFGSQILSEPGSYFELFQSINGCDSAVTLSLSFDEIDTTIRKEGNALISNFEGGDYQWYIVEGSRIPIAGATDQQLVVSKSGRYLVRITKGFCSDFSEEVVVTTVGVQNANDQSMFRLYPNPNNGRFTIEFEKINEEPISFDIIDMNGKIVFSESGITQRRYEVDSEHLPRGIYMLKLKTKSDFILRKVIIQ